MAGLVYTGILQSARRRKARTRPEPTIRWGRQLCWNRCTRVQPPADRDAPPPGMLLGCFLINNAWAQPPPRGVRTHC